MKNTQALTDEAAAFAAKYTHLQLHTAGTDPVATTSQSAAPRVAAAWVNTNGVLTIAPKQFTGGAASGPVVRVTYWTAATAGSCGGGTLIPAGSGNDLVFNAAGTYTLNTLTETPASA